MIVVSIPGASLLDISVTDDGRLRVRCPGCTADTTYRPAPGETSQDVIAHDDGCPVHRRIRQAVAQYERETVRRG